MPLRSWRLQLCAVAITIVAAIFSAQSFASAREAAATYLIQPGDSLSVIAASTGIAVDKLINVNGIKNPDFIVAGQTLSLDGSVAATQSPGNSPSSAPAPDAGTTYTVKAGDTVWGISVATNVSFDALLKANNLNNADQLTIGQTLTLPASASTTRGAPAAVPPTKPAAAQSTTTTQKAAAQPKPTASGQSVLEQKVAAEALRVGGPKVHVGVAALNLTTGDKVSLHAEDAFPSASVIKLPILVELERQIASGKLSWTDSIRAEAGAMIAVSDNTAANQIADVITPKSVNDTMAKLGLGSTRFLNLFSDTRSGQNPGQNQSTPNNMVHLLHLIATDQVVSDQVSADIRALLARNVDRSKLVRLLPADARVAHKSGWYDGVANDVGIVTVDRVPTRWIIAVFTENLPDAETGNQLVATVSKAVYDAWAP